MEEFCPTCEKSVDFYIEDGQSFYPICGRTKELSVLIKDAPAMGCNPIKKDESRVVAEADGLLISFLINLVIVVGFFYGAFWLLFKMNYGLTTKMSLPRP
jgi:hypothetical protein